jgi:HAD superfamily 5'-nucleotidase-like hydrolase
MSHQKSIPASSRIFVNRTLNLNQIKLLGFDMDYTVVTYNVPAFEDAAYRIVMGKLVEIHHFPQEILTLQFDPNFIIRGLVIDIEKGNLLKVNRYGYVKKASHGTRFLTMEEQKDIYRNAGIDWADPRYYIIHTLFSLAEGSIFAQLVTFYEERGTLVNYRELFRQIRDCMDDAHQEGSLKGQVIKDPARFLIRKPLMIEALKKLRQFGKKIALITNSDYEYSQAAMDYCFSPYLSEPWQDFFDLTVVAANKPIFFQVSPKFLRVDKKTGNLSNFHGPIEYGGIYQGGNARALERSLGLTASDILYVGDHIYGDVVTLKEAVGWRTGLVIQEMAVEVPMLDKHLSNHLAVLNKMAEKENLETRFYELKEQTWKTHRGSQPDQDKEKDHLREKLGRLDEEISLLISEEQKDQNPFWGEVMRAGNEESRFATLVERYACIYMSCVSNFFYYSPFKYFRSRRRYLAHDPNPYQGVDN